MWNGVLCYNKRYSQTGYHGQLDFFLKSDNAKAWLSGKALVMCATSEFGVGIECSVCHPFKYAKLLEEYYQAAGRAGRDGNHADCILM